MRAVPGATAPACSRATALALLVTLTACGVGGRGRATGGGDTAFVGVAVGLETPERYANVFEGVQLALDSLNAHRAHGVPVLAMRRAPAAATSAVEVAAAFRDEPRMVGVVGHTESAASIAAAPIYEDRAHGGRDPVVAITPTASATQVTRASRWMFRVCPVGGAQARALARYVADSLGLRRTGVIFRNDPSGQDFVRTFTEEYARRGGVVVERDPFTEDIAEFTAYARRLTMRRVPSVVIQANAGDEIRAIRALHAAGSAPLVLGTNPPGVVDAAAAAELRGFRYLLLYAPDGAANAESARFAAAFTARTRQRADHWAALGFDAAMLIGSAVHAVGPDRRGVRDWIAGVGRSHPAYAGATGAIRFDDNRDPIDKQVVIRQVAR
jgi:branched-chain amino acid transport system substrate-binding protein